MKSIRHNVVLGLSACALSLVSVGAWGAVAATPMPVIQSPQTQQPDTPQTTPPSSPQATPQAPQTQPDTPKTDQSKSATFTGTVVKQGDSYVLRDASGAVYQLDDPSRAQQFEGKSVTVTGKLDAQSKMIHVDNIAEAGA